MNIDLEGKVVIVTGASRGIGREISAMSAEANANVVLVARSKGQLADVAAQIQGLGKGEIMTYSADVTDSAMAEDLVKAAINRFGGVYALVNNAGTNSISPLIMAKEEDFRALYEVNVFAAFRLTKAAIRHMIRVKSGRVINISSTAAKYGSVYNAAYSSSKAALLGFTRSVARETAKLGITVNAICPWHTEGEWVRQSMVRFGRIMFGQGAEEYLQHVVSESPQERLIEPREVAALTVFLMSPEARSITGQSLNVCGGVIMD